MDLTNYKDYEKQLIEAAQTWYGLDISENTMTTIFENTEVVRLKKGEILCEVGDELSQVGFVLSGMIRSAFITYEGEDVTLYFHGQYSMVMDDSLLAFSQSSYRCEVIEDTSLLFFDAMKLKKMVAGNDELKALYTIMLESALKYKLQRERDFLTKNATQRYEKFITEYPEILRIARQRDIASYLGIKPESLSRISRKLNNKQPD